MSSAPIPALVSVVDATTGSVNKHTPESQMIYEREQMEVQSTYITTLSRFMQKLTAAVRHMGGRNPVYHEVCAV
jgi:hypothetical protein